MPLKEQIAARKSQQGHQKPELRRNPEIDAKLDAYIAANPKLIEYYNGLTKDDLVRKLMLGKMQRSEYTSQRNQEIVAWVEENPEIKAKVEQRIRNVPPENRERAFITAAKSLALNQTVHRGVSA